MDEVEGICPAIAIRQRTLSRSPRSTVATATEIHDHLRLLFARAGRTVCDGCGEEVRRDVGGERGRAPPRASPRAPGSSWPFPSRRSRLDGALAGGAAQARLPPPPAGRGVVETRRTRPRRRRAGRARLVAASTGSCSRATRSAGASSTRSRRRFARAAGARSPWWRAGARLRVSERFECARCAPGLRGAAAPPLLLQQPLRGLPRPATASATSSRSTSTSWCPTSTGAWRRGDRALEQAPLHARLLAELQALRPPPGHPPGRALGRSSTRGTAALVLEGDEEFQGVLGFFRWLEAKKYKVQVRVFLSRYRGYQECPACGGSRLRPEALRVRRRAGCRSRRCAACRWRRRGAFLAGLSARARRTRRSRRRSLDELERRLRFLEDVGLDYLGLDRAFGTLSGGEAQRIALAAAARHRARRHALRPRRALGGPAPPRHGPPHRHPEGAARPGKHRGRGGARPGHRARRRLRDRPGAGGGRAGRARRVPGHRRRAAGASRGASPRSTCAASCGSRCPAERRSGNGLFLKVRGASRPQPEGRGRAGPARGLHLRHRGVGLRQVDASSTTCSRAGSLRRRAGPDGPLRGRRRGGRVRRRGRGGRPVAASAAARAPTP